MIAGTVQVGNARLRIYYRPDAVSRLAAAASLDLQGEAGKAEGRRFTHTVVHRSDRQRWGRASAQASEAEQVAALAQMVEVIVSYAEREGDAEQREWAEVTRAAWDKFRAGDRDAFTRVAAAAALAEGDWHAFTELSARVEAQRCS